MQNILNHPTTGSTFLTKGDQISVHEQPMFMLEIQVIRDGVVVPVDSKETLTMRSDLAALKNVMALHGFDMKEPQDGLRPNHPNVFTLEAFDMAQGTATSLL